jgi:hypothetical protein
MDLVAQEECRPQHQWGSAIRTPKVVTHNTLKWAEVAIIQTSIKWINTIKWCLGPELRRTITTLTSMVASLVKIIEAVSLTLSNMKIWHHHLMVLPPIVEVSKIKVRGETTILMYHPRNTHNINRAQRNSNLERIEIVAPIMRRQSVAIQAITLARNLK